MEEKANEAIERAREFLRNNGYANATQYISGILRFNCIEKGSCFNIPLEQIYIPSDMSFVYDIHSKAMYANESIRSIDYILNTYPLWHKMAQCTMTEDEYKEIVRKYECEEDPEYEHEKKLWEDHRKAVELANKLIFEE